MLSAGTGRKCCVNDALSESGTEIALETPETMSQDPQKRKEKPTKNQVTKHAPAISRCVLDYVYLFCPQNYFRLKLLTSITLV